jgi:hypothetical protein
METTKRSSNEDLAAGDFADAFRVFLHVFLAPAAGMPRANELGVIPETRRVRLAAMSVSLWNSRINDCDRDERWIQHTFTNSTQLRSSSAWRQA